MKKYILTIISAFALIFTSCEPEFENPVEEIIVTAGEADFSRYVALGNSLTAGYTDGALFMSGQENSFPNILATQMTAAGGGSFTQPLMPDDIGGFTDIINPNDNSLFALGKFNLDIIDGSLSPVRTETQSVFSTVSGSYGNMGVPGAKSFHLAAPGYGNAAGMPTAANPYFVRFASTPNTSVLADAAAQQPTFFTLWIGANDVLSYATSGGIGVNQTGNIDPTTYGSNDITDPNVVANSINTILETLVTNGGAKGAIANLPNITDIPFFTTVPYAPISGLNSETTSALNSQYALLNQIFVATGNADRQITFGENANGTVIKDETLSDLGPVIEGAILGNQDLQEIWPLAAMFGDLYGQVRQSNSNDLLVFTSQTVIGKKPGDGVAYIDDQQQGIVAKLAAEHGLPVQAVAPFCVPGLTYPLEDRWVLIPSEIDAIQTATNAYNASITTLATNYNLALVDTKAAMEQLNSNSGLIFNGNTFNATYVQGGAFSLDGVHPTGIGYAIIANYFTDAINAKYGSTLPKVNPNNYPGIKIP